jgi:SAM-dependent methyltransferase
MTLDGKLFRAPITSKPQRVLDMGTGTGIWAIDFADEFPCGAVIGTDLSPIQPTWVPPNCKFLIDDLESEWTFSLSEPFDFIHGKGLAGSINDWARLYQQIYQHLKPGGWVEMQEYEGVVASDDDPELKNCPSIDQWQHLVDEATSKIGKKLDVAGAQKQHMIDAGFVDVRDDIYKVPSGRWPQDPKLKEVGMYQLEQIVACVEPFTLAFFTRVLQWSPEETEVLMAKVKSEMRNKQNHLHAKFHFVYGRRPL